MIRAIQYLISFLCFFPPLFLHALSDKIAASVDDKVITENDIKQRFNLIKRLNKLDDIPLEQEIRADLLDQLVQETVLSLVWKKQTTGNFDVCSKEEVDIFIRQNHLEDFSRDVVKDFCLKKRQREIMAREQFSRNISISDQEIQTWLANPQNLQALPVKITFKIAYSSEPLTEEQAQEQSRRFSELSLAQAPTVIFSDGRWEYTDKWQFFTDEDEHVSLFIEEVKVEGVLSQQYDATVYFFEFNNELTQAQVEQYHKDKILPESVQSVSTKALSFNQRYQLPEKWANSHDLKVGDCEQVSYGDKNATFIVIEKITPLSENFFHEFLIETAQDQLAFYKVEESFRLWSEQAKMNFYVDFLNS